MTLPIALLSGATCLIWIRALWPDERPTPRFWRRISAWYWRLRLRRTER